MPLGTDYTNQDCAVARSLEVVGERWTLLIVRDLFYGIRRYNELRKHIGLPPATLTDRLNHLVEEDVVERIPGEGARDEYRLTPKGEGLWPVVCGLAQWGNANYVEPERRMGYKHRADGGELNANGSCSVCGEIPDASEVMVQKATPLPKDAFAVALQEPHRLLQPLRP
ncbi:helix-turn-helix transcriptional regulator [Planctomonas sp. JC2975]|uniref:winged helix-turn-helix transcriptional regulator n=1 Tax=Planctomonas sp. JC2975 TaxID=2729626 RepID=UPI001475F894|nr:helix-turn-helix domain-containing protein [Planctomonas sp. JC2975]NNC13653.1 helix-turn-helix transcriptional regulator [Planctomonas sp. JC2975]